jgi:NAD(P)-dependent dehydrogenase (short-subunit alcohol dehydrogenase family)
MNASFDLRGKVAVVTGAAGLLGRQHVAALVEAGAHAVLLDKTDDVVEEERAIAASLGVSCMSAVVDICDRDALLRVRDDVLRKFDRIDVLVNNAALNDSVEKAAGVPVPFEEHPVASWRQALDVNVTGTFLCCQVFGAEMAKRGRGSIVNIASTYGIVAPDQSLYRDAAGRQFMYKSAAYSTSKAAVIGLTRHLAAYWGARGVRVNALSPGGVHNGQEEQFVQRYSQKTPLGRMAEPTEYRGAIVFLASDASSYLTGANIVVDGGFTVW